MIDKEGMEDEESGDDILVVKRKDHDIDEVVIHSMLFVTGKNESEEEDQPQLSRNQKRKLKALQKMQERRKKKLEKTVSENSRSF